MALSVSTSNGGNGLSNLLRQTRPVKAGDEGSNAASGDQSTASTARPYNRAAIDSTGSGTAQITAALTIYLSKLGGADEDAGASVKPQAKTGVGSRDVSGLPVRSSASDLLRVLDNYGKQGNARRLTA